MKVLHLDEQMGWRGGEQQASWLIQGLVRHGHQVYIAARPGSPFIQNEHGGVNVHRIAVPLRNELDFFSALKLARLVKQQQIDIIHAHSSHAHMLAVLTRNFAGRSKVMVSRRVAFAPKNNIFNRWKYRQPDKVVGVSHKVAEVLRAYGLPEDKVDMVHSSVHPERLDVPPLPREELGVPEGVPLIVSAGSLVGHKDHLNLINALPRVLKQFPDARVIIAGEGDLRPQIEARITELSYEHVVTLLGHRNDAPRLIRAGDVYVSSSWSEGLGTSILEALTCQTPVVAAMAGGADEMIIPEETGYLVPCRDSKALAEAIIASLSDPEKSKAMAVKGRQLIEDEFVTERMVEGTIRVYEELLKQ